MIRQEIYGYLLTHHAISALICKAATEAGIDPDRVKFKRTVRIVRRRAHSQHDQLRLTGIAPGRDVHSGQTIAGSERASHER
jgi:hypothetical protein